MHRTNTTKLTTFTLPFPDAGTFVFTSSPPASSSLNAIRITIPPHSSWRMPFHWHPSEKDANATDVVACERVTCVSVSLCIYVEEGLNGNYHLIGSDGMSKKFAPRQRISWYRTDKDGPLPLTVDLVADHALWRNICSAVLDANIFPQLASTPWWLRALFAVLAVVPSWRNCLLNFMLWVQIQTIFFANDFRVHHGYVPVTWPWLAQPFGETPPDWAARLQLQSSYFIARAVMTNAYRAGTLFLGMKGSYIEYTPSSVHREEKH